MSDSSDRLGRLLVIAGVTLLSLLAGWALFVEYAADLADLLGILLVFALGAAAVRTGASIAASQFPGYNVAEVGVEGPITRDGGGNPPIPTGPVGATADEIADQIDLADDDPAVDALLVKLNTPGGEVVPSEDIRNAAERFDGPTIAYATDVCASGGYWIASGCDEIWAREPSIVGSIGVIGSRPNVADLADRLGVSYEQFTAGEYKDAGTPLKEIEEDEREYLQSLIDGLYDRFVDRVAEGRELSEGEIRETEARIYLGTEAAEMGLVDEIGTREDVTDRLEDELGEDVSVREFEPQRGPLARVGMGARSAAYAFGAGLASRVTGEDGGTDVRFRV
ncbi:signal peptide peptidase SppA [Halolamina sp. CBA1230]|uniref:signal peptide peptidase SppA n=1 Tax=Halolamina sp. CBA1230 TaxID=1853690 RepID=UPI0009A1D9B0|nr:signal peptide peptidase SppA [Halolamina sp. CBA1230]QKY18864.1 signal peptide peptidase SppA [Halolamina sp. CBA1230]